MDSAFGIQVLRCEHERELHIIHRLDPLKAHQADNAVRIVENIHILNSVSIFIQAANIVIFHTNEVVGLDAQNIRYRDIPLINNFLSFSSKELPPINVWHHASIAEPM